MGIFEAIVGPVTGIIDRIIPDPKARDAAKLKLLELQGSQEMVQAIHTISDLARQNASSTEEVQKATANQTVVMEKLSSSALELSNISLELEEVVSRFQLTPKGEERGRLVTFADARPPRAQPLATNASS